MACNWRGITSRGRTLEVCRNDNAPTVAPSEFAGCTNQGYSRRFGYPPPLISCGAGYSAWCLYEDETIVSIESYDCDGLNENQPYDCLNGNCVPANSFNTPGYYPNLAACKSSCGKSPDCKGECLSAEQLAALDRAIAEAEARIACK